MGFIADILSLFTLSKMEDSKRKRMIKAGDIAADQWRAEHNLPPLALSLQFREEYRSDPYGMWVKIASLHKGDPFWDKVCDYGSRRMHPPGITFTVLYDAIAKEYFAQYGYDYLNQETMDEMGYWRATEKAAEEAGKDIIDRLVDKLF